MAVLFNLTVIWRRLGEEPTWENELASWNPRIHVWGRSSNNHRLGEMRQVGILWGMAGSWCWGSGLHGLKILDLGMASMTLWPYETLEGPSIIGKFCQLLHLRAPTHGFPIELPRLPEDSGKWQSAQLLTLTSVPCSFQLRTMGLLIASLVTRFILRK